MEKHAGVLIKAKDTGNFLLLLRCTESGNPLTWNGVSGGVEEGEDFLEGLKREVNEEIGIDPEKIQYTKAGEEESKNDIFYYYEGLTDSEFIPTLNDEHLDWGWFKKDDLPEPLYPNLGSKIKAYE